MFPLSQIVAPHHLCLTVIIFVIFCPQHTGYVRTLYATRVTQPIKTISDVLNTEPGPPHGVWQMVSERILEFNFIANEHTLTNISWTMMKVCLFTSYIYYRDI